MANTGRHAARGRSSGAGKQTKRSAKKRVRLIIVLVAVVALIGVGIAGVIALRHGAPVPEAVDTPSPTQPVMEPTDAATTDAPSDASVPDDSVPPVDPEEVLPIPVETPPETPMAPSQIELYCRDFQTILAGAPTPDDNAPEYETMPWEHLATMYAELIAKYTAASKNAPASLGPAYANVISYLQAFKDIVDRRDLDAYVTQFRLQATLNDAMDLIDTRSRALCKIP